MFIFEIKNDNEEDTFVFNGNRYVTPCSVPVTSSKQIDILNKILREKNIIDIKVIDRRNRKQGGGIYKKDMPSPVPISLNTIIA